MYNVNCTDGAWRGTKLLDLKDIADEALNEVAAQ
jgi:hypothetical protein